MAAPKRVAISFALLSEKTVMTGWYRGFVITVRQSSIDGRKVEEFRARFHVLGKTHHTERVDTQAYAFRLGKLMLDRVAGEAGLLADQSCLFDDWTRSVSRGRVRHVPKERR
jgi:hypothetical protein